MTNNIKLIDAGQLMERWGLDAVELALLVFEKSLKAFDVLRGNWVNPNPGPNAWMAGPGAFMTKRELTMNSIYPLEKQKEVMSKILRFDPKDVENFEEKFPELISIKTGSTNDRFVEPSQQIKLADHQAKVVSDDNNSTDKNVFFKNGEYWEIKFKGEKLPPLKEIKGFKYIVYLLERPNESILFDFSTFGSTTLRKLRYKLR